LAPQATFELAELLVQADRREQAIARYQELIDRFPKSELAGQARYAVAWGHYQSEDFAAAARALDGFDKLRGPTDELREAALELLVWSRAKSGDARGTLEAFSVFSRVSGDEQRALGAARLAISALAEKGQVREAQALISGLLDKVEDRAVAASLLVEYAWLALDQKQLDQAEESVRAALKIARAGEGAAADPTLAEACFFVAEGRFEGAAYDRAAELYRIASSLGPSEGEGEWAARSLYKEGFCHLNLGREADAVRAFARLVEEHPGCELWGEGLFLLGEAHYRAERVEEAAAAFEQLLRAAPRHETVHKALFRL
jgi:TolA-binding protein